jgi:hypothetical protein
MYCLIDPTGRIYVTKQPAATLWGHRNQKPTDAPVHQWLRTLDAPPAQIVLPVADSIAIDAMRACNPGKLINAPRAGKG